MKSIRDFLNRYTLHDSILMSARTHWDGKVDLEIDFDYVWNKELDSNILGIRFFNVYEIVDYKLDRVNIIMDVEIEKLNDYDYSFVVCDSINSDDIFILEFSLCAGGNLTLICSEEIEYIFHH